MLIEHRGKTPSVHDSAYVAPTAVLCGDVVVGPGSRVLHGAVLTAEDGEVRIGRDVVVMENAVVKGRAGHPAVIGDFVLVGPHAHVNGADVRAGAFVATGAALFPGSVVGSGAEIRVNGVVQVNTTVEPGSVVPMGWVAVGTPATVRPPDQHRDIWAVQRELDFPGTVYGVPAGTSMRVIMTGQSQFYGAHLDDVVVGETAAVVEAEPAPADVTDALDAQPLPSEAEEPAAVEHGDHAEHGEHGEHAESWGHGAAEGSAQPDDEQHTGHETQAETVEPAEHPEAVAHPEPSEHLDPSEHTAMDEQRGTAEHAEHAAFSEDGEDSRHSEDGQHSSDGEHSDSLRTDDSSEVDEDTLLDPLDLEPAGQHDVPGEHAQGSRSPEPDPAR